MKRSILLLALIFLMKTSHCFTVVTIGTGTGTQKQPFGMWASYERSAALYLSSEIGSFGSFGMMINSLGWYVGTGDPTTCPTRIYLKTTTANNLTAVTWAGLTSGATLVYDATTNFTIAGWRTIDIADFAYTSGNLLVLCETNFGGSGATFYPIFRYSYFPNKHQFWQEYDNPPLGNGTVNENRPNIQITYTLLTDPVVPPSGFMAMPVSSTRVDLNWRINAAGDPVMVAFNTVNNFGVPSGNYVVGDNLAGGGTVIYSGSGSTFSQTTGLSPGTTYYYMAWSVQQPGPAYSISTGSAATTLCYAISAFPYTEDFEAVTFPPSCWTISALPWLRSGSASAYGAGSASAFADFYNTSSGDFEIVSPELSFGSLDSTRITFDHAYATYTSQVDKLELWYSTDNGATYGLLSTWLGGLNGPLNTGGATTDAFVPDPNQWAAKSCVLPAGTDKIFFRGISGYGNNLYIDNIRFNGICPAPVTPYAANVTSFSAELGWTITGSAANWQIVWGISGFDTVSGGNLVTGITTTPYLLEGLVQGQDYGFYVRTDCGGAFSPWQGPVAFSTACDIAGVPYYENFDYLIPPATGCLEVTDNNNDGVRWETSSSLPYSYPNSMFLGQNSQVVADDWFFTPGIDLYEGTTYAVSFGYRSDGEGVSEKLELRWGSGPQASEMTGGQLWNDPDIQNMSYLDGYAAFVPAVSGVFYLGWHCYNPAGSGFLSVDEIAVNIAEVSWNGSVSEDWDDPTNWTPPVVPNGYQNVTILSGTSYSPTAFYSGTECRDLVIDTGATFTIDAGAEVTVRGNITIRESSFLNNQGLLILKGNLDNQNPN